MRKHISQLILVVLLAGFCGSVIADPSVQTLPDGSTQITTSNPDGTMVVQTQHPDGTSTSEVQNPDGSVAVSSNSSSSAN